MYGKLIFIKKTGGDGSKYPVTEKKITIGRIEECLIRIYNPQVEEQHCQLIVNDNGQVILKNLSKHTFLNDKPLALGEVPLSHGDIFKVGDRIARWEYLPSSKYYQQLSSNRSLALAKPTQKSLDSPSTSGSSTSQVLAFNQTLQGNKRRFSERAVTAGNSSRNKVLKVSSANKIPNGAVSMFRILSKRHSLQCRKMLFSPSMKHRQNTSEVNDNGLKTPNTRSSEKSREANSLKAKIATTPTNKKPVRRKSTPIKKPLCIKPSEKFGKSVRQSSLLKAINLNAIAECSSIESGSLESLSLNSSQSPSAEKLDSVLLVTPKKKNVLNKERLVKSEKKLNSISGEDFISGRWPKSRKLSLTSQAVEKPPRISSLKKEYKNFSKKFTSPVKSREKSKSSRISNLENSPVDSPKTNLKVDATPKTHFLKKLSSSKTAAVTEALNSSNDSSYDFPSTSGTKKAVLGSEKTFSRKKPISCDKRSSVPSSRFSKNLTPNRSLASNTKLRPSTSTPSQAKKKSNLDRRTLNSLAKEAAVKLKTSRPLKPDKNKKAALLVLGKASWKQIPSQNVKMLLKKKIVKKAIKQSSALPLSKNLKITNASQRKQSKSKQKKKEMVKRIRRGCTSKQTVLRTSKTQSTRKSLKNVKISEIMGEIAESTKSIDKSTPTVCNTKFSNKMLADSSSVSNDASKLSPTEAKSPNGYFTLDRRCSKRLSSKNNISRPDFMELSPTALGLIPKNFAVFKTPRARKRCRSVSLITPNVNYSTGIIKSASTQKIKNRRNVRFSSKNLSFNSDLSSTSVSEITPLFENVQTPDISLDAFVSSFTESSSEDYSGDTTSKKIRSEGNSTDKEILKQSKAARSGGRKPKCAQKLLMSLESNSDPELILPSTKRKAVGESLKKGTKKIKASNSSESKNAIKCLENELTGMNKMCQPSISSKAQKSPIKKLDDFRGVKKLLRTPKVEKTPKNALSDLRGVKELFKSPRIQKSPKNDLSDLRGVKRLLRSPRIQKSPKNDLSDLRGVKGLFRSPKIQKSPKNDLSDLRGVKGLFRSPKIQKSPKNDLSDLRGVKRLLRSPRIQKSPKNDLSDLRGVKRLLRSPRIQKSPKNDLSDLRGVKRLLRSPRIQKSPKNDLSDLRGVKELFKSPRIQKSPKNDLSDLRGVKGLFKSPRIQKSPKNDLSDLRGVKGLFRSPKIQKSPKNDLSDLRGVKRLLRSPRIQKSPKNELNDLRGVKELFRSPKIPKSPKDNLSNLEGVKELFQSEIRADGIDQLLSTSQLKRSSKSVRGVKQLLRTKISVDNDETKFGFLDSQSVNLSNVRGKRARRSSPKQPKNDLSDVTKVRESFSRIKPINDLNVSLTGVAQLFDFPSTDGISESPVIVTRSTRSRTVLKAEKPAVDTLIQKSPNENAMMLRGRRTRKAANITERKSPGRRKRQLTVDSKEEQAIDSKRRLFIKLNNSECEKAIENIEKEEQIRGRRKLITQVLETSATLKNTETKVRIKRTRSRVSRRASSESSPPQLRRKLLKDDNATPKKVTRGNSKKVTLRVKGEGSEKKRTGAARKSATNSQKVSGNSKTVSKVQSKTRANRSKESTNLVTSKAQRPSRKRIQEKASESKVKVSPRRTRSQVARSTVKK